MSSASADEPSPSTVVHRRRRSSTGGAVEQEAQRVRFAADYQDHREAVVAVAMRICGPDHADEVAEAVFLTLLREPDRMAASGSDRRACLLTLASLRACEILRREYARRAGGQRANPLEATERDEASEDRLVRDAAERVASALDRLPLGQREAITVAFFGQLSYRATAARLAQSEESVRSSIGIGLGRLREVMIDFGSDRTG